MTISLQLAFTDQPDHGAGGGGGEGGGGEDALPHLDLPRVRLNFLPANTAKDAPLGKPAGDKSPSY